MIASTGLAMLAERLSGGVSGLSIGSRAAPARKNPPGPQASDAPEEIRAGDGPAGHPALRIREETKHARLLTPGMAHYCAPPQNPMGRPR